MPRRSLSLRASPGGLLVPVGCPVLSVGPWRAFLSSCPVLSVWPWRAVLSWFFFGGGSRAPAAGAGLRGSSPRAPKTICHGLQSSQLRHGPQSSLTAMASKAPSSAMVPVCLFFSGGPRPAFLSVSVLRGLHSAHPPLPDGTVKARDEPFGRGELCQSSVVCVMCIWFVSCPCLMSLLVNSCPAVFV